MSNISLSWLLRLVSVEPHRKLTAVSWQRKLSNRIYYKGRLKISARVHIISDIQIMADRMDEDKRKAA